MNIAPMGQVAQIADMGVGLYWFHKDGLFLVAYAFLRFFQHEMSEFVYSMVVCQLFSFSIITK